jgi:hypothetical protein
LSKKVLAIYKVAAYLEHEVEVPEFLVISKVATYLGLEVKGPDNFQGCGLP